MAVTAYPYGQAILALGKADFDFSADTLKCMLTTSSYTPNLDTDDFRDDVTNEVAAGGGYTSGGVALTTLSWTYDSANNRAVLTADPAEWTTATFTARYAVIYKVVGSAATDPLLSYVDFGADQSPAGVDFTLDWTANGIFRITIV